MHPLLTKAFLDGHGRVRSGWKALAFLVVFRGLALAAYALLHALRLLPGLPPGGAAQEWLLAGLAALAGWICVASEGQPFASLGFRPGARWGGECLAGTVLGFLIMLAAALAVRGAGGFHWVRSPGIGLRPVLAGAWMYLAVAFFEETLYRGYPFQRLVQGLGPWGGQLLVGLWFASDHWGNPGMHGATLAWATLNIGLAALLLGLAWIRTGSLALPIGIHLGWNWTQGSLLGFGVSGLTDTPGVWTPVFHGRPEWLTGGAFGLEASLPCTLVCAAAILLLARWKGTAPAAG